MADEYYFYTAKSGDRWDVLANRFLGNMYLMGLLIAENPHVKVDNTIEEGTVIRIPKIEKSTNASLPIWMQER